MLQEYSSEAIDKAAFLISCAGYDQVNGLYAADDYKEDGKTCWKRMETSGSFETGRFSAGSMGIRWISASDVWCFSGFGPGMWPNNQKAIKYPYRSDTVSAFDTKPASCRWLTYEDVGRHPMPKLTWLTEAQKVEMKAKANSHKEGSRKPEAPIPHSMSNSTMVLTSGSGSTKPQPVCKRPPVCCFALRKGHPLSVRIGVLLKHSRFRRMSTCTTLVDDPWNRTLLQIHSECVLLTTTSYAYSSPTSHLQDGKQGCSPHAERIERGSKTSHHTLCHPDRRRPMRTQ